jgi:hypothetical protein
MECWNSGILGIKAELSSKEGSFATKKYLSLALEIPGFYTGKLLS